MEIVTLCGKELNFKSEFKLNITANSFIKDQSYQTNRTAIYIFAQKAFNFGEQYFTIFTAMNI